MNILYKGIDVSTHNEKVDWTKIDKSKVQFVMIRAGFGFSTVDTQFKANIEGAIKAGLHIGIYWFSYAGTVAHAKMEAEFCLKTIEPYRQHIKFPVCFDWEYKSHDYVVKEYGIKPTIIILEALFAELNCSKMIVTSGYRTAEHDKAVGGNGAGQHTLGRAADVVCYGKDRKIIPAEKVCCTLEDMGGIYGIGYISKTAVHVDTRAKSTKWWGDETKPGSPNISKLGYNSFHRYFNM